MATGYKELDDAICRHIAEKRTIHPTSAKSLRDFAANELGTGAYKGCDKEWRLIDRRLQALKKAGVIQYARQTARWVLVAV